MPLANRYKQLRADHAVAVDDERPRMRNPVLSAARFGTLVPHSVGIDRLGLFVGEQWKLDLGLVSKLL